MTLAPNTHRTAAARRMSMLSTRSGSNPELVLSIDKDLHNLDVPGATDSASDDIDREYDDDATRAASSNTSLAARIKSAFGRGPTVASSAYRAKAAAAAAHAADRRFLEEVAAAAQDDALGMLHSHLKGLTDDDAMSRLARCGLNQLSCFKAVRWYEVLFGACVHPFNFLLLILALADVAIPPADFKTFTYLLLMVTLSVGLRFWQEMKSNVAAIGLRELVRTHTTVLRRPSPVADPRPHKIDQRHVVPGDIVKLTAGDMFPGDCRLLSGKDLFVSAYQIYSPSSSSSMTRPRRASAKYSSVGQDDTPPTASDPTDTGDHRASTAGHEDDPGVPGDSDRSKEPAPASPFLPHPVVIPQHDPAEDVAMNRAMARAVDLATRKGRPDIVPFITPRLFPGDIGEEDIAARVRVLAEVVREETGKRERIQVSTLLVTGSQPKHRKASKHDPAADVALNRALAHAVDLVTREDVVPFITPRLIPGDIG
ncbi:hypothetical protein BDK51DRAFT_32116 [Blyttiomyces helicus]|uniref:Cation-transporting P-type ATPase N-terminal domain-containing protein n=1 Tax=Blyttiomyces helicus TaxID=388810 RepID=A0A4P9W0Z2_9FUNG|nr:hypothetical protein BDK51DRAFT_32116 [Blyttiomyces helicus]|eukprot:RKO85829.1 hypothetical protein BDK51DRAFT_32116 [Blyttiomyces helicus]